MNHVEWQLQRFEEAADRPAMVWRDQAHSYADFAARYREWNAELSAAGVEPGASVGVLGDYSPRSVMCLLALVGRGCVLVPLSWDSRDQHDEFYRIAELDHLVEFGETDAATIRPMSCRRDHPLLGKLRDSAEPGLILFSSGSTGHPKAIVHSLPPLLAKFRQPRHSFRTVNFLLFDHIGGVNTMFYTLANLGCTVVPRDRTVAHVCEAIAEHRVELLPTSPSFLNLMLLQGAHQQYDLTSLKLVTYGTEVMPERTLELATQALPDARFQQTYGLSEVGILRSKSKANSSLFVKIGGEDYETKVVNGTLRVRAESSMLGYLNAPSPFDEDGWFDTGDAVVQEGDYYRILGRESDIINVGGQKVYPAEVEKVVAELTGVIDVAVRGEPHLILGQIVGATVQMSEPVPVVEMRKRIAQHCKGRLQPFMVPAKVRVVTESPVNYRFKKVRR
jgi:long-chain acyl-CoA synthetase